MHAPEHEPPVPASNGTWRRRLTVAALVAVIVVIVVLHLTGVIGAGSH